MRVRAHAARPLGVRGQDLLARAPVVVEELLWPVGAHPRLERLHVPGVARETGARDLVGAPGALGRLAVDLLGARPALRRAQDDHRPARALAEVAAARAALDLGDLVQRAVELGRNELVDGVRVVAGDE